jgi:hypothetical protein
MVPSRNKQENAMTNLNSGNRELTIDELDSVSAAYLFVPKGETYGQAKEKIEQKIKELERHHELIGPLIGEL